MTFKEKVNVYWKYYISLENQLLSTGRYVELDYINNGKTYSMEYLELFQAVCSEIDVIGKVLAKDVDKDFHPSKNTGINEWWYYITQSKADLIENSYSLFGEYNITPWRKYKVVKNANDNGKKYILSSNPKAKTPKWWIDYNSVKHNRTGKYEKHSINYAKANLKNLFYAFAALYSLEVQLLFVDYVRINKDEYKIPKGLESNLFNEKLPFYKYLLQIQ